MPDAPDLRQGLTFTQTGVLDLLEQRQRLWAALSFEQQLDAAFACLKSADLARSAAFKHSHLTEAAARMFDAAERQAKDALRG